jgi:hypothetical protein
MNSKNKYFKYKNKYINLKKKLLTQYGGQQKNGMIDQLHNKKNMLINDLVEMLNDGIMNTDANNGYKDALRDMNNELTQLGQENANLKQNVDELSQSVESSTNTINSLTNENKSLSQSVTQLQGQYDQEKQSHLADQQQYKTQQSDWDKQRSQYDSKLKGIKGKNAARMFKGAFTKSLLNKSKKATKKATRNAQIFKGRMQLAEQQVDDYLNDTPISSPTQVNNTPQQTNTISKNWGAIKNKVDASGQGKSGLEIDDPTLPPGWKAAVNNNAKDPNFKKKYYYKIGDNNSTTYTRPQPLPASRITKQEAGKSCNSYNNSTAMRGTMGPIRKKNSKYSKKKCISNPNPKCIAEFNNNKTAYICKEQPKWK